MKTLITNTNEIPEKIFELTTSQKTLTTFINNCSQEIKIYLAEDPKTPQRVLKILGIDSDAIVQKKIFTNSSINIDFVMQVLVSLKTDELREYFFDLYAPKLSKQDFYLLAKSSYMKIKILLAGYEFAPIEALLILFKEKNYNINLRRNLSKNKNLPVEILTLLASDEDEFIQENVAKAKYLSSEFALKIILPKLTSLAAIKTLYSAYALDISCENLILLTKLDNVNLLKVIASSSITPKKVLTFLSKNTNNVKIKCLIAENDNTPSKTLTILASDLDYSVKCSVANNDNTTPKTLALLSKDDNSLVRCAVANNLNTTPKILTLLGKDSDNDVKYAVSTNINATFKTLESLSHYKTI